MIKVKNIHNGNEVYFRFFANGLPPKEFWYTKTSESLGFGLGFIRDYEPLNEEEWKEIKDEN